MVLHMVDGYNQGLNTAKEPSLPVFLSEKSSSFSAVAVFGAAAAAASKLSSHDKPKSSDVLKKKKVCSFLFSALHVANGSTFSSGQMTPAHFSNTR